MLLFSITMYAVIFGGLCGLRVGQPRWLPGDLLRYRERLQQCGFRHFPAASNRRQASSASAAAAAGATSSCQRLSTVADRTGLEMAQR